MIDIKDDYIVGWNSPSKEEMEELKVITLENQFDNHGNLQWKWLKGKAVFKPMKLTADQLEKDRTDKIEKEIPYTIPQEIALINKGIKNKEDPEYVKYRKTVNKIKKSTEC